MLEGDSVSVGCETLSVVLLLLPPLQDARPPMINTLAKSEHRPLGNGRKGQIESDMAAPGSARHWRPDRLCTCSAGNIARPAFDAGPMLTLVESSVGELCPYRAPESGISYHPSWGPLTVCDLCAFGFNLDARNPCLPD